MVEVGGRPILWHIMKSFAHHGITEFIVCTGYKGDYIRDYFLAYEARNNDFTITLGSSHELVFHDQHLESSWTVTVADTGESTQTGGRVKRVERYVDGRFMVTYGDGLADVDIGKLLVFHDQHGRLATVTTVQPPSRFGVLELDDEGQVDQFREKPQMDGWVNAGFFVFEPEVFGYLHADEDILEQAPLAALASDRQLMAYRHHGFWQPMDTYRESKLLNELWAEGAPWKVWT